jgi:hypothetical protein
MDRTNVDNSQFGIAPAKTEAQDLNKETAAGQKEDASTTFAKLQLQAQVKVGANWFYWIAGLSLVNTLAALSGSTWRFLLGLGITRVIDELGSGMSGPGKVAALVVEAFIAGFFVLLGSFAGKQNKWAFVVGMALFGLDACISLLAQDWIGLAFHGYALFCIYRGYARLGELNAMKEFTQVGTYQG